MTGNSASGTPLPLLLTASVGCAMTLVDTNVVAVAVPTIYRQFGGNSTDGQWVISAFFLCFAASLLPAGAIADRGGRRRAFLSGVGALAVVSLLCGSASSIAWLQFFRALQGIATAFVLAPALALIGHRFRTQEERNWAWAIWGGVMGATMVVAPVAGGAIVEAFGWRWAFFINVPICAGLAMATFSFAEESRDPGRGRLDPAGILLFAAAMFGLIWALINGQTHGWASPKTLAGFIAGILALAGFVFAERVQMQPMVDLKLFRSAPFVGAVWAMFAYAASGQVMASLFPIFFQAGMAGNEGGHAAGGLSAFATGLAMLPFAAAMMIFPYIGARLGRRLSSPSILTIGLVVLAIGNSMAAWGVYSNVWLFILPAMFVIGSGAGLLNGETQKAIMATMPSDQTGIASGISTTARFSGVLIGFAALNAVLSIARSSNGSGSSLTSYTDVHAIGFAASLLAAAAMAGFSALLVRMLMRRFR